MNHVEVLGGGRMPVLGLGTYRLEGRTCYDVVRHALAIGYRHFDTAEAYKNEAEIGEALQDGQVGRQELFVTTKIWPNHFRHKFAKLAAVQSLKRLRMSYVDLLLLHWPSDHIPLAETLAALSELLAEGMTRAIGVSNFPIGQLREIRDVHGVHLACNQIEFHALLSQRPMINFARLSNLLLTAHSPLAQGRLARHSVMAEIGGRYNKTASQVALRWIVQQGTVAIPKTSNEIKLRQNMDIFDFHLAQDEMAELSGLNTELRIVASRRGQWD